MLRFTFTMRTTSVFFYKNSGNLRCVGLTFNSAVSQVPQRAEINVTMTLVSGLQANSVGPDEQARVQSALYGVTNFNFGLPTIAEAVLFKNS